MAEDNEQLVVSIGANIANLERQMRRAVDIASKNFDSIEKRAQRNTQRIEKQMKDTASKIGDAFKSFGLGVLGGVAGGLAIGGLDQIVQRVGKVAEGVANIGSAAKRAGIDVKAFQELAYVADQNRIEVDKLTDGIKELNLRADEFIKTGGGTAAEAFGRLGFQASDLAERLKDPSKLFVEIMGRMQQLDRAAQIRVGDELFGEAGERFVELLDRGAAGIRAQINEAHELGVVLDADVIAKADEIDRRFSAIARTIDTNVKRAVVDLVSDLSDWLESFNSVEEQTSRFLGDRLADIGKKRLDIENKILALREQADTGILSAYDRTSIGNQIAALEKESGELHATEQRILAALGERDKKAGEEAKAAAPAVTGLGSAITGTGSAATGAASGLKTYADAIRAIKNEVPELAEQLATLDARTRIDAAYRAALNKARSIGETIEATTLRDAALSSLASKGAREAAGRGMLDLIGYAEGTDKARGYNETLGYGAFTGGDRNLVLMTLDQIDALQTSMLAHPDNNFNSSALGRYQITRRTLRGLRDQLGLSGGDYFDASMQDRLAQELLRQRGGNVAGLRNEWEGLRRIDDATIRQAYDGTSITMPAIDPAKAANLESAREQVNAYAQIVAGAKAYVAAQGTEQQALGLTATAAQALRYEQQMLNDAQARGIALTPEQRAEIGQLAAGMAEAETRVDALRMSQEQAAEASRFFGSQAVDALSGILSGTLTAEDALQQFLQTLIKASLQAALLGEGPLASLFGMGGTPKAGGGAGGLLGGLLGMLFGFADGGYTGPGSKYQPAGIVHAGEYVMPADAVRRVGVQTLARIHHGALAGFADGGLVGGGKMALASARPADAAPTINISAPVTVNGSAGTKEQNQDLADRTAKALEATMRGVVTSEIQRQMRPGGMANNRAYGR
jgi:muramidase (phage lysozyme)